MRLLLMRHGEAVPGRDNDPGRPLTERGRKALSLPDDAAAADLSDVRAIWSSPWLRAEQTASAIQSFTLLPAVENVAELLPSADPGLLLERLEGASVDTLLLIGHQPLMGRVAALLCDGFNALPWVLNPADIVVIDLDWPAAGLGYQRRWHRFPV